MGFNGDLMGFETLNMGISMGFKQQTWYFNGISLIAPAKMRTSFDFMAINGGLVGACWI